MPDVWDIYKGQAATISPILLRDGSGSTITTFTGSEALSLQVWTGDDQAPQSMANSSVTWVAAASGTIAATLSGTDTANLAAQPWRMLIWIGSGATKVPAYECLLNVKPAPGSAAAPTVYATYDDMAKVAQFLNRLVTTDPAQLSSLGEYLSAARQWLDRQILSRAQRILETQQERHYPAVAQTSATYTTGLDTGPDWGPSIYPQVDVDAQLLLIKGYLDAGGLDLTDGMAKRLTARYAVAELCASQVGSGPGDTPYQTLAAKYRSEAIQELSGFTARIATGGTPATLVF